MPRKERTRVSKNIDRPPMRWMMKLNLQNIFIYLIETT
jgi:hypothetical protein